MKRSGSGCGGLHRSGGSDPLRVYLCFTLVLIVSVGRAATCTFPSYVQSHVNGVNNVRDWRGMIRNQNREVKLKYKFEGDRMQTNSTDPTIANYTRICVQTHRGNDTFLVAHEERGQTQSQFTCMRIIRRGHTVIQIRQAVMSTTLHSNLCSDDNLLLDGWLIIDTNSVMNQRQDCSLHGGFNMQVYDKSTYTGVCDGYLGETRLESECIPGEGLNFYFRQAACVPDGLYMYHTQRTHCFANWFDKGFNFILLHHDTMPYMWVLRYPEVQDNNKDEFIAVLMKDLYVTSEKMISVTNQYLQLTMSRQNPKVLNSLCFDDYEICSVLSDPCSYSEDMARTCAKTCGFCSDTKPSPCAFPDKDHGIWMDATQPANVNIPDVHFNATTGHIPGIETFHCINWVTGNNGSARNITAKSNSTSSEQMVVSVASNGCRPRYSCLATTRVSNILFLQMSQTRLWPLVDNRDDVYSCDSFRFTDNKHGDKNPYRRQRSTFLLSEDAPDSVPCDFSNFKDIDVQFSTGVSCPGNVTQLTNDSAELSMPGCPGVEQPKVTFKCVARGLLPWSQDTLQLIRATSLNTTHMSCWVFPGSSNDTAYVVEAERCSEGVVAEIQQGLLIPVATVKKRIAEQWTLPTTDTTTEAVTDHTPTTQKVPNDASHIPLSTAVPGSDLVVNVNHTTHNVTGVEGDGGQGSVLVTAGIAITFVASQIGLLCCKCSC